MTASATAARYGRAIDIRPDELVVASVSAAGGITGRSSLTAEPELGPDGVADAVTGVVKTLRAGDAAPFAAVGVSLDTQVRRKPGEAHFAPNLRWRNVPFRDKMELALGIPALVTTDVRAAAYGEREFGAGQGHDHIVKLVIGTGVGGAVFTNGVLVGGVAGNATELGHMTIVSGGRECRCPNHGCLEAYVGGWAIVERAQAFIRDHMDEADAILSRVDGIGAVGVETIAAAAQAGDGLAARFIEETALFLSDGVSSLVNVFNPSCVILGGPVVEQIPQLVSLTQELVPKRALGFSVHDLTITRAALAEDAVLAGAGAWALDSVL